MTARGLAGPFEEFQAAGRVQQVGDALHGGRRRVLAEQADDGVGMADAGQAPGADQSFGDETFEQRADLRGENGVRRHARGGVARGAGDEGRIRHHVGVQEEHIELRQAQPLQAGFDRAAQGCFDRGRRQIAQVALAGNADPGGQLAVEGGADHILGLAVAVAWRQVQQRNAGGDGGVHGGDAFLERRLAPQHTEAAAAQRQDGDGGQCAECVGLHDGPPGLPRSERVRRDWQRGANLYTSDENSAIFIPGGASRPMRGISLPPVCRGI